MIDPTFANCFDTNRNLTKDWFEEVQKRMDGELKNHVVIFIFGETGSFKSSVAQSLAIKFAPKTFSADSIVFDNNDLLRIVERSMPKDWFIRDESPFEFGVGSFRIEKQIQILAETLRQRQNSLIFIAPTERPFMSAHYILHTIDLSEDNKYARVGIMDPTSRRFIGFILVEIYWDSEIWKNYQKEKEEFLEDVIKMDFGEPNIEEDALRVLGDKRMEQVKTKKELVILAKEIFKSSRTGTEIDYICTKANQMIRMQDTSLKELYEQNKE